MITLTLQEKEQRVVAVRESATLNGIEYVEVVSEDQRTLRLVFIHPLPGEVDAVPDAPVLTRENFRISGGERIKNILVTSAISSSNELTISVNQAGDFSNYVVHLVTSPFEDQVPPGFDPVLSHIDVNFKISCPNNLDCAPQVKDAGKNFANPNIDYLAKDYRSFRRLMLERASVIMPQWRERSAADQQIMLTELIAFVGDQLSYYQDAVSTEAYLGTANQRRSLARHARILDYRVHEGCNARTWVHIAVAPGGAADGASLPQSTVLLTADADQPASIHPSTSNIMSGDEQIFETMHAQRLYAAQNEISFYTWSHAYTCLAKGATSAVLVNDPPLALTSGAVLLLEQVRDPQADNEVEPQNAKRHCVRITELIEGTDPLTGVDIIEVHWHLRDALPFSLCLESLAVSDSGPEYVTVSVARGNIILADHGLSVEGGPGLTPAIADEIGTYRPSLNSTDITHREIYHHSDNLNTPASSTLMQLPRQSIAAVTLFDGLDTWNVQADLLASDRFAREFVVEIEHNGQAFLRFGDNVHGREPTPGQTQFNANYRVGNGTSGNVGTNSLTQVVTPLTGIQRVYNPLPGVGGVEAERAEAVRRFAPQAFRIQERAVTEEDWVEIAQRHPEIQKAYAEFRWTGSWYTVFLAVDREGGLPVLSDIHFKKTFLDFLNRFRVAGYDLALRDPVFVSLEIVLRICLQEGFTESDVLSELVPRFSSTKLVDGSLGFFHADRNTFGDPVYLSRIYQHVLEVEGICSVEALTFKRWGESAQGEITTGLIEPAPSEILRCASNPSLPEHGNISFEVHER